MTSLGERPLRVSRSVTVPGQATAPPSAQPTQPLAVSVVLPCYNERGHVLAEVERITRALDDSLLDYEVLVVDDGSTDGTAELLETATAGRARVRLIRQHRNRGSGTARRIGTLRARGEIVVWTDADMSYPNERIPEFVRLLQADRSFDQVVGARRTEMGTHKLARVPAKWVIRQIACHLTGAKIPDLNSGLRAFRRDIALPYLGLLPSGFSCVTTLTVAFLADDHDVRYVPIDYAKRAGRSKFHPFGDAYLYLLQVLRMVMYFNPIKVLMPFGLWLMGIGGAKLTYDLATNPFRVAGSTTLTIFTGLQIVVLALLADLVVRSRLRP